jgi:hypothetical protein
MRCRFRHIECNKLTGYLLMHTVRLLLACGVGSSQARPAHYEYQQCDLIKILQQDPNHMVDLLGVFVLGQQDSWGAELGSDRFASVTGIPAPFGEGF